MGTNYYWRHDACTHCHRHEQTHVGKSSHGWSFGFHGFRNSDTDWQPEVFGRPVVSRADWARVFKDFPGVLVNEYDEQIPDPVAWITALEPPTDSQIAREYDRSRPRWPEVNDAREWRDTEGFRFYAGEFS